MGMNTPQNDDHQQALASEGAVRLIAIEVLRKEKKLFLPRLRVGEDIIAESRIVCFKEVTLETTLQLGEVALTPDVTLTTDKGQVLFVDLRRSNSDVTLNKINKEHIQRLGVSCLEIDLLDIAPVTMQGASNVGDVSWLLMETDLYKRWIYNHAEERLLKTFAHSRMAAHQKVSERQKEKT